MRYVAAFVRFWYAFVVGDDWRISAGVLTVLAIGALVVSAGVASAGLPVILAIALVMVFALPMVAGGRGHSR